MEGTPSSRKAGHAWYIWRHGASPVLLAALGMGLLLLALLVIPLVRGSVPGLALWPPDGAASDTAIGEVTLDRIIDDPNAYIGTVVRITGEFEEMVGRHAFRIEDDDALFDDDLLVVTNLAVEAIPGWPDHGAESGPVPASRPVPGTPVTVTGVVRRFDLASVEAELQLDLDDTRFAPLAGRPVIVARSVGITPTVPVLRDGTTVEPTFVPRAP